MKTLRAYIVADTLLLTLLGLGLAFLHRGASPTASLVVGISPTTSPLGLVAAGLGALALVLWLSSDLPLAGDRRRLTLWLGFANLLMAALVFAQPVAGRLTGPLVYELGLAFLLLAVGLGWAGKQSLQPEESAGEIAALRIPEELRQTLLQQVGEAAAQEERNRLARDLHDSIKQQLFSINVGAAAAQERWEQDPEGARKALADVRRSAREAVVEMQTMLHQLQPKALGTAGLIEALQEQCEALGYRTGACRPAPRTPSSASARRCWPTWHGTHGLGTSGSGWVERGRRCCSASRTTARGSIPRRRPRAWVCGTSASAPPRSAGRWRSPARRDREPG